MKRSVVEKVIVHDRTCPACKQQGEHGVLACQVWDAGEHCYLAVCNQCEMGSLVTLEELVEAGLAEC